MLNNGKAIKAWFFGGEDGYGGRVRERALELLLNICQ